MTTDYIQALQVGADVKAALETILATAISSTNAAAVQTDLDATEATIVTDLGALRTGVIAALAAVDTLATAQNALGTKLNADGGVTDTNYVTNNATNNVATHSPGAITTA